MQPGLTVTLSSLALAVALFLLLAAGTIVTLRRDRPSAPASDPRERRRSAGVDLSQDVEQVFHDLSDLARRHFVQLETAVPPGVRLRVDPAGLRAMLTDAIAGAILASDGGHVLVTVFTDPSGVEIDITDDGPGNADAARNAGLRAGAMFLAAIGGGVSVDARPGQGTTVALRVPSRWPRVAASAEAERIEAMTP